MDKNVSIVKVDKRPYRKIAQENWGLTKEQMKGMHVHHRIRRCDGGTNDPSNLYVCSPWFHRWCWHNGEEWIEWANKGGSIGGINGGKKVHEKKDELGRSIHAVQMAIKASQILHSKKDEAGRSIHAMSTLVRANEKKDDSGKSVNAVRGAKAANKVIHAKKDENGKSVHAVRAGKEAAKKLHEKKDERGKSVNSVKGARRSNEILHSNKDSQGRSLHAVRMSKINHRVKDEAGKSVNAVKAGREAAKKLHREKDEQGRSLTAMKTNNQIWESTVDGYRGNAGQVAQYNRRNGWDPNARVRVG
jgi:hypothetical protein